MASEDVVWCEVCDAFYSESRIDVLRHLKKDHTLSHRLGSLMNEGQPPEDTHAE